MSKERYHPEEFIKFFREDLRDSPASPAPERSRDPAVGIPGSTPFVAILQIRKGGIIRSRPFGII